MQVFKKFYSLKITEIFTTMLRNINNLKSVKKSKKQFLFFFSQKKKKKKPN